METALYKLGQKLGDMISGFQIALVDKKINLTEGLHLGGDLLGLGYEAFCDRAELTAEASDGLNDEEQKEFEDGFNSGYVLPDAASEKAAEKGLAMAVSIVDVIADMFIKKPAAPAEPAQG